MKGTVRLQVEEESAAGITVSKLIVVPREEIREVVYNGKNTVEWTLTGGLPPYSVSFWLHDDESPQMAQLFYLRLIEHTSNDLFVATENSTKWSLNGNQLNEWLLDDNNIKDLSEYLKQGS